MAKLVHVATVKPSVSIPTVIPIEFGDTLHFGRSKDADVYLDSTQVKNMISRTHAKVVFDRSTGRVTIFDLNSTNGVYVNDLKIDVCQLSNGDRVTFGGRGKGVAIGAFDAQPNSEFIYEFQQAHGGADDDGEEEEESVFETAKTFTDNIQLIGTWLTTAALLGSYLFADESSAEFSFAAEYVAPVFALVGVPFNRVTFTTTFVGGVGLMLGLALLWLRASKQGKAKDKAKAKKLR